MDPATAAAEVDYEVCRDSAARAAGLTQLVPRSPTGEHLYRDPHPALFSLLLFCSSTQASHSYNCLTQLRARRCSSSDLVHQPIHHVHYRKHD
jgi:hypothetical protein